MDDVPLANMAGADQLTRMNRLATIARLVAGLAHELNNSLQIIGGTVELLTDRTDVPADVMAKLQRIGGQAEKATLTIRRALGYTREAGAEIGSVDLAGTLRQVMALRHYPLGRAGISFALDGLDAAPFRVHADEQALVQALLNLVMNAEEALAGRPSKEIRVALAREGDLVRVRVSDSGPGVAGEIRERIFEPFFTTRLGEGAIGLGLCASRQIIERAGGRLWLADGSPGATFVVELPAVPDRSRD
jgi:signal transduction histidine kinase